jgi:hypothetical protein
MGYMGTHFSTVSRRNGSEMAQERPRTPKRHKMPSKLHVGDNTINFHASHANILPRCWGEGNMGLIMSFLYGRPYNQGR